MSPLREQAGRGRPGFSHTNIIPDAGSCGCKKVQFSIKDHPERGPFGPSLDPRSDPVYL